MKIKVGTRGSTLARAQCARFIEDWRAKRGDLEIEECVIRTQGDVDTTSPLHQQGGVGLFTSELERALEAGEIDVAVHSLKDLPTQLSEGLELGAVPERASPWDAFISEEHPGLVDLPRGARVATGSLRRRAEIAHARPDIELVPIRGNIDTRLEKYRELGADALVLAEAGLVRAGRESVVRSRFGLTEMTPAPAQGALGVEMRAGDEAIRDALSAVDCERTRACVTAERSFLRTLEGGCHAPIGAFARVVDELLLLTGTLLSICGSSRVQLAVEGPVDEAAAHGERLAAKIRRAGGQKILDALE